jgi:hypothetical protein
MPSDRSRAVRAELDAERLSPQVSTSALQRTGVTGAAPRRAAAEMS